MLVPSSMPLVLATILIRSKLLLFLQGHPTTLTIVCFHIFRFSGYIKQCLAFPRMFFQHEFYNLYMHKYKILYLFSE